jgi:GT2 family glycosyltransferase
VIIPTYHREQSVVRAVQSVLDEAVPGLEVLVIDDSPDGTARPAVASIGDERVAYLTMPEPTGGRPALVRNLGIERARGTFLYFLDDDDCVAPGALASLLGALHRKPRAGVAYGTVRCVGPDVAKRDEYNRWFTWAARTSRRVRFSSWLTTGVVMFRGTLIINSCCMIRRTLALELGGYDPDIPVYEDVEFFTRGIRHGGHAFVDHTVLVYSTGEPSIIHDLPDSKPITRSYRTMHAKYRAEHGQLDYRALQVVSKLLPIGKPKAATR